jgi:hypothetical protein
VTPDQTRRVLEIEIEHLALGEAELLERCADLECTVTGYREVCFAALNALRALTVECSRLRERLRTLAEEWRKLRGAGRGTAA